MTLVQSPSQQFSRIYHAATSSFGGGGGNRCEPGGQSPAPAPSCNMTMGIPLQGMPIVMAVAVGTVVGPVDPRLPNPAAPFNIKKGIPLQGMPFFMAVAVGFEPTEGD